MPIVKKKHIKKARENSNATTGFPANWSMSEEWVKQIFYILIGKKFTSSN